MPWSQGLLGPRRGSLAREFDGFTIDSRQGRKAAGAVDLQSNVATAIPVAAHRRRILTGILFGLKTGIPCGAHPGDGLRLKGSSAEAGACAKRQEQRGWQGLRNTYGRANTSRRDRLAS